MSTSRSIIENIYVAYLYERKDIIEEIEKYRPVECASIRAVICTDKPGAVNFDLGLGILSDIHVISILEGPCAWFHSNGVSIQTLISNGRSIVPIDYSLGFDSNFAERLRLTVSGKGAGTADHDAVKSILMLKAQNQRVQFDLTPFLIENARLARENQNNLRPLDTAAAFRMIDELDWECFRKNNGSINFCRPQDVLKKECTDWAGNFLEGLKSNPEIQKIEKENLSIHALLLRFSRIWHQKPRRDKNEILHELLYFSIQKLGFIPRTELHLIWNSMGANNELPFFGPIMGRSSKMLSQIRGMAWDMTFIRHMERIATKRDKDNFFVPYFVSLDRRLCELIRFSPIKLMLIDDINERAIPIRTDEIEFQESLNECIGMSDIKNEMTPEKIEIRKTNAQTIDLNAMQNIVNDEEKMLAESFLS